MHVPMTLEKHVLEVQIQETNLDQVTWAAEICQRVHKRNQIAK